MTALSTIAKGDASRIVERRRIVVRAPDAWASLWAAHAGPVSEPPVVDFASSLVAGAFAGQQGAGHSIEIVGAVEEEGGTRLVVEEKPSGSDPNTPFHIVALSRMDGEIRWTDTVRQGPGAPTEPTARIARGAHSRKTETGLRPRTGALLSYLAGPASGLIMLVAEPVQPFVRFHAWQSIIALGALIVGIALCYALALASLFFSVNGLAVMVRVATGVWVALLVLWALCLWQAWKGRAWKLPIAGEWAERLATRGNAGASFQQPAASSKGGTPSV